MQSRWTFKYTCQPYMILQLCRNAGHKIVSVCTCGTHVSVHECLPVCAHASHGGRRSVSDGITFYLKQALPLNLELAHSSGRIWQDPVKPLDPVSTSLAPGSQACTLSAVFPWCWDLTHLIMLKLDRVMSSAPTQRLSRVQVAVNYRKTQKWWMCTTLNTS